MQKTIGQFTDYVEKVFGSSITTKNNISVVCPICFRNKGNGYANKKLAIRTNSKNHYPKCWVCDFRSKNLCYLIKTFYPNHYNEYIENYLDSDFLDVEDENKEETTEQEIKLPFGCKLLAENQNTKQGFKYLNYLKKRNSSDDTELWKWKFLYTLDDKEQLNRIIIPSFDSEGYLNFYTGRSLYRDGWDKYKNSNHDKRTIIFNEINIDWTKPLTLVEGPFDLLKCNNNASCLLGSSLDINHYLMQMIVLNSTPVVLALDPEAINSTRKIAKNLLDYGIEVEMIDIPNGIDVGAMSKLEFMDLYNKRKPLNKKELLLQKIKSIGNK